MPNKQSAITVGKMKYIQKRDNPLFRFEWLALRGGAGDVVGC
jgi:hypothetical protein